MLTFSYLLNKKVSTSFSSLKIIKDPSLSNEEKDQVSSLLKELDESEKLADEKFQNLFTNNVSNFPVEKIFKRWKDENTFLYILKKEERIIGICAVRLNHPVLKNSIHIRYLCISDKERSQGYGRYLLEYVMRDLKKDYPTKHLLINVFDKNIAAKKLYSSVGFRPGTILMIKF